jgi:hypothetical protein
MESLTTLYAEGLGTQNFEGLGAAKNLTILKLNGCSSATDPNITCNFLTSVSLPAGLGKPGDARSSEQSIDESGFAAGPDQPHHALA